MAGEEQVFDRDFLLEEISFALIDREFRELFGMFFLVSFPKEEQVRTLPPDFPLAALDFLFSEVSDVPLPAIHTAQHSAGSGLPAGCVVTGRSEISQNTEASSCPGVSFPALSLLDPA